LHGSLDWILLKRLFDSLNTIKRDSLPPPQGAMFLLLRQNYMTVFPLDTVTGHQRACTSLFKALQNSNLKAKQIYWDHQKFHKIAKARHLTTYLVQ